MVLLLVALFLPLLLQQSLPGLLFEVVLVPVVLLVMLVLLMFLYLKLVMSERLQDSHCQG